MGRFSKKKAKEISKFSDWFFHKAVNNREGLVSLDDISRQHTKKHYKQEFNTEQLIDFLKSKVKRGDTAILHQLGEWAKAGYQEKLNKAYVEPIRRFYKKEDRLIYSVVFNNRRGWKFISSKDFGVDQAALMNEKRRDAYQNNCEQLLPVLLARLQEKEVGVVEREKIEMQIMRFFNKGIKKVE